MPVTNSEAASINSSRNQYDLQHPSRRSLHGEPAPIVRLARFEAIKQHHDRALLDAPKDLLAPVTRAYEFRIHRAILGCGGF